MAFAWKGKYYLENGMELFREWKANGESGIDNDMEKEKMSLREQERLLEIS